MTFEFKRSYFSLVELKFGLKGRKVPRTIYAGGRLSRPFYIVGFISCPTYRQGNNPYMDTAFNKQVKLEQIYISGH